jgi:hypothetical protein
MKIIKIYIRRIAFPILTFVSYIKGRYQILAMRFLYSKGREIGEHSESTLLWVPGGMPGMLQLEAAIASALKLRGNKVHAVICDGVFSACVRREITDQVPTHEWKKSCNACKNDCAKVLNTMRIPFSYIGDHVTQDILSDLKKVSRKVTWESLNDLSFQELNIGNNVRSAVLRFLKGHEMTNDESLIQEYAFSGLVCAAASRQIIEETKPSRIFMSHGTYVDWGPALHTALAKKVPVTAWMASYLPACFYFRHVEDGVHIDFHNMSTKAWDEVKDSQITNEQSERLGQFLEGRYKRDASFDMKRFKPFTGGGSELRHKYQFDSAKPLWGVMAHINWDTVSDYSPMVYESFNQWMNDTISVIKDIRDVQWVIKVHPAESWDNPESGVEFLIKKYFPDLPEHIRVLPAEEDISPLDFFNMVDGGVTVYGTSGLELALHGKPVILAGDAHYGRKGFTYDANSKEHYRELLSQVTHITSLSEDQIVLAKKYAYCYFMQRQIPIEVVKDPKSKWWNFQFDKKELLLEGRDPVIDFICEKIVDRTDFIMDEHLLALTEKNMELKA